MPLPTAVTDWLTVPAVAEQMDISVTAVRSLLADGKLLAFRAEEGSPLVIPADMLDGPEIVKHLPGVISLLRDARFSDAELMDWLTAPDPTIPGTPLNALRENRGTEIKRRAQAEL